MLNTSPQSKLLRRLSAVFFSVIVVLMASGCASTTSQSESARSDNDPLESVNRKIFAFNEGVDKAVLKPTATAYKKVVPPAAQKGVSNFFSNLKDPWTSVNLMLQGRVKESATTAARFGTNTTIGVFGIMDVAKDWGMPKHSEDFGLTLDKWGIGSGPYVVLPIFGPSNVRDALSIPVNSLGSLQGDVSSVAVRNTLTVGEIVSKRADFLEMGNLADQVALDKYLLMREASQKRRNRSAQQNQKDAQATERYDLPPPTPGEKISALSLPR